ncbi:MAG: hypothetical protein KGH95_06705 [Thaumarchaeota archaeon]|nr:hypothetical protein [Nitrososphaerota archaeon]
MKSENMLIIILVTGAGLVITYFAVHDWQSHTGIQHGISCSDELKKFEGNLELSKRQQTEAIVVANQTLKKLVDASSYCEFMGLGTLYTGYGSYQILNINLNDTQELTAQVSLQNDSVVSYDVSPLTRTGGPAGYVEPTSIILPYLFFGAVAAGIAIYLVKIKRQKLS